MRYCLEGGGSVGVDSSTKRAALAGFVEISYRAMSYRDVVSVLIQYKGISNHTPPVTHGICLHFVSS